MRFALAGNQNCGKTTLFNALTGSNQHVGNFPGVTVEQKVGDIKGQKNCTVVDLPGIYSLRPYTQEEIVTRDYIINEKPDGIINIVDATNIERNLYLTLQLLELRVPMVLALNMMDEVRANGGTIDVKMMSDALTGITGKCGKGRGYLRPYRQGCRNRPKQDKACCHRLLLRRFRCTQMYTRCCSSYHGSRKPCRHTAEILCFKAY